MASVASLLAMDRTTLTANLKPLARRKLLKVSVDKDDRRGRRLSLTAAGRKALKTALPLWKRAHAELDALIAEPDRLRSTLRRLA